MKDDGLIVSAWADAVRQNVPAILATVVKVSGSAYRRPGARMFFTENGVRIGSISGGCLEGDVLKKAWWLTSGRGAAIRVYDSSSDDETIWEFGLGCNGVIHVLLERWDAGSNPVVPDFLAACREQRRAGVLATVLSGEETGRRVALFPDGSVAGDLDDASVLARARATLQARASAVEVLAGHEVFLEYVAPPVPLLIVGAGQDALPVVRLAAELGWDVTVVDCRAAQARAERFPLAARVVQCDPDDPLRDLPLDDHTCAVLMSHSYPQDRSFLRALHGLPLRYLGVLGPRKRTERMMAESGIVPRADLHSPVGLDLGADTPEEIALAIVAEIQATLSGQSAGMLFRKAGPIHADRLA